MAYIVVGVLVWILAGLLLAVVFGRMIKVADSRQRLERSPMRASLIHTLTRR